MNGLGFTSSRARTRARAVRERSPELSSVMFWSFLRGGWTRISTPLRGPSSPATWARVALPPAVSSAKYSWKPAATAPKTVS